jgi:hypothetical protein
MPKYYAKGPINHDGTLHTPGSVLSLTEAEAKPMLEIGTLITEEQFKEVRISNDRLASQASELEKANARIEQLEAQLAAKESAPQAPKQEQGK